MTDIPNVLAVTVWAYLLVGVVVAGLVAWAARVEDRKGRLPDEFELSGLTIAGVAALMGLIWPLFVGIMLARKAARWGAR